MKNKQSRRAIDEREYFVEIDEDKEREEEE